MRTSVSKSHLNLSINPDIAELFNSMSAIHGKTYSGFLEEKILELAEELAPDMLMELKIKETRELLSQLESDLPSVKSACKSLRNHKKEELKKNSVQYMEEAKLEEYRETMYQRYLDTFTYQVKHNKFDWTLVMADFKFKTKIEAQEWVYARLKNDGITRSVIV